MLREESCTLHKSEVYFSLNGKWHLNELMDGNLLCKERGLYNTKLDFYMLSVSWMDFCDIFATFQNLPASEDFDW